MEKNIPLTEKIKTYRFEMFSPEGEKECLKSIKRIYDKIGGKYRLTLDEIFNYVKNEVDKISKKYPEVNDTEPEYHFAHLTQEICKEFGYGYKFDRFQLFLGIEEDKRLKKLAKSHAKKLLTK